ncbi:MAG: CoA-binding protein [Deltaproteobacteria bacterium]|nr:CoA-binding protein [Deltaproteobacteria bacterium]
METEKGEKARLHDLFNPESVAIVGVPRGMKMGKFFLMALQDQGYPGHIYPVHPEAGEIDGLRAYPRVSAIPGPVDLAIILVPHHRALAVVRDCASKGVKGAVLFTAGYKETGTHEGKALEEELAFIARNSGMRIFGPNCMGIYCPGSGLSFFPELSKRSGPVGFISHSGSLANIMGRIGPQKGLYFSKAVSLGNECDLTAADLLGYLGDDPATGVIGAYLEGIKDGPAFLKALRDAAGKKPVVLWKLGLTPEGNQAAASHTGAMGGSKEIWDGVVRQGGAIQVKGFDTLMDMLMGFSLLPPDLGDRMAILSGPGGLAVAAAEACGNAGLRLAEISQETRFTLSRFIPPTGTSLKNPIDVGLSASLEIEIYTRAAAALAADPGVDAVLVAGRGMTPELNRLYTKGLIQALRESGKPFVAVNVLGFDGDFASELCSAGIPFFNTWKGRQPPMRRFVDTSSAIKGDVLK